MFPVGSQRGHHGHAVTTNTPSIDRFVHEMRRDPDFAPCADKFAHAFAALDREGDQNPDASELCDGLLWIARQPRTLDERITMFSKLIGLRGYVVVNMSEFTGWR